MQYGGHVQEHIGIFCMDHLIQSLERRMMHNYPNKLAVIACLLIHDIDKLAIGVDYKRDSTPCWACQKCGHTFISKDLPSVHKYSPARQL